ncbi:hypothetical protein [Streptomyces sp. HUAS ZL42]|uniref:hypothetical protein n=1 Tax=Streptomyces sp. HUAS ZL42 TaxID=3231715 RepID=UPI00345E432E
MVIGIILAVVAVLFVGALVSAARKDRYAKRYRGRSGRVGGHRGSSDSGSSWWAGGGDSGSSCGSSGHSCGGGSSCGGGGSSCGGGGGCGGSS